MTPRAQDPAQTRRALVAAAVALLDRGGRDAVTLREVGTGAGVSRTAPYRHFADKDDLLAAVAATAWSQLADALRVAAERPGPPADGLRQGIGALVDIGRARPHLYRLLFASVSGGASTPAVGRGGVDADARETAAVVTSPDGTSPDGTAPDGTAPDAARGAVPARSGAQALMAEASAAQDAFLVLVERVVGAERARPTTGLLLAAAHGVVDLDVSGNLPPGKWDADADALLDLLVRTVAGA